MSAGQLESRVNQPKGEQMPQVASLDEAECRMILWLSDRYEANPGAAVLWPDFNEAIGPDEKLQRRIFDRLDGMGLLGTASSAGIYPEQEIISAARQIRQKRAAESAPRDILETITKGIGRNPWTAWPLIALLALAALASLLNNIIDIIQKLKGKG